MAYSAQVKLQAKKLRKQGYSVKEIAKKLKIAQSTSSLWIRDIKLNSKAIQRLNNRRLKNQLNNLSKRWLKPGYKQISWTPDKLKTIKRLYQSGISMREVGEKIDLNIWVVRNVMKRHGISRRTQAETKKIQFEKSPLSFSPSKNLTPKERKLKVAGLMLYWAEGSKRNAHTVDFANSDPKMIRLFSIFLKTIYQIKPDRLRGMIYCYPSHNINKLTDFWCKTTNIPRSQFTKPYIRQDGGNTRDKMKYGLVHVRYSDKRLLKTIMQDLNRISIY